MHVAFEDQLVQKVMPKLRGIDTRGKSKDECLDKIRGQLVAGIGGNGFNLAEDFDLATELGYGQFIWQSANYLEVEDSDESAVRSTAPIGEDSEVGAQARQLLDQQHWYASIAEFDPEDGRCPAAGLRRRLASAGQPDGDRRHP